jgi:hypothetical protein
LAGNDKQKWQGVVRFGKQWQGMARIGKECRQGIIWDEFCNSRGRIREQEQHLEHQLQHHLQHMFSNANFSSRTLALGAPAKAAANTERTTKKRNMIVEVNGRNAYVWICSCLLGAKIVFGNPISRDGEMPFGVTVSPRGAS